MDTLRSPGARKAEWHPFQNNHGGRTMKGDEKMERNRLSRHQCTHGKIGCRVGWRAGGKIADLDLRKGSVLFARLLGGRLGGRHLVLALVWGGSGTLLGCGPLHGARGGFGISRSLYNYNFSSSLRPGYKRNLRVLSNLSRYVLYVCTTHLDIFP